MRAEVETGALEFLHVFFRNGDGQAAVVVDVVGGRPVGAGNETELVGELSASDPGDLDQQDRLVAVGLLVPDLDDLLPGRIGDEEDVLFAHGAIIVTAESA